MKKYLLSLLTIIIISQFCFGQNVAIPDANFKAALLAHTPIIDSNSDGEIQITEASSFNQTLDISQNNISDLTGIETFINITELLCNNNLLTSLDVTNNISLQKLNCSVNQLPELYIAQNTLLTELYCTNNTLTSLDITNNTLLQKIDCAANSLTELNISQNLALTELESNGNNLTTIDTSLNTNLEFLNVAANSISSLNLSTNINLNTLRLNFNPITTIDISSNINLKDFSATYCYSLGNVDFTGNTLLESISLWYSNQTSIDVSNMPNLRFLFLRSLDINTLDVSNNLELFNLNVKSNNISVLNVSTNINLTQLSVDEFLIKTIDASNNTNLTWLDVSGSQLKNINIKNGANSLITNFQINNTPNLIKVCVDDYDYATANFTIPTTSYFTEICSPDDCDPITVNHSESFEDTPRPQIDGCWRKIPETNSSTYYVQSTASSHSGDNGVTLRTINSADAYLITPQLEDFNPSKRISFWLYSSAQTTLSIGTLSDPDDVSTFTFYRDIDSYDTGGYQWREYKIDFFDYTGSDVYVAFKLSGYAIISIDDFEYLDSPNCIEPTYISSIPFSTETILEWSDNGNATSWDIEYGEEGFAQGTGTVETVSNNPYILTGLSSLTSYDFYIRSNCGVSEQSDWSTSSNFTTICDAINVEYNYDFDDTNSTEFYNCWTEEGSIATPTGGYTDQSTRFLRLRTSSSSSTPTIVATPELVGLDNSKRIKLWVNNFDGESGLTIGTVQNPNDLSTFTEYQTIEQSDLPQDEWKKVIVNFDTYSGTDRFIAIRQDISDSSAYIYIDDITYQAIPSCLEPTNLETTIITDTEISLQWVEQASANNWDIEYGFSGFTQGEGIVMNSSTDNNTITGLIPDTKYDIYVRSNCSSSDSSEWITIYNINTGCGPVEANYYQHFDESLEMANCWLTIPETTGQTNGEEITISNQNKVGTSGYSARFQDYSLAESLFLISPEFSDLASGNTRIKFWLNTRYSESNIIVGTLADPTNSNSFTPIQTILNTDMVYREWKQFIVNLDGYTGTDTRVAFKMELIGDDSSIYDILYFDAFEYSTIPTCQTPTELENIEVSDGELTLGWQDNSGATQWEIEYGETGFWQGEGTIIQTSSNPYNIQGLTLNTTYDFYVRAICDSQNVSDWSEKTTVDFGCGQSFEVGYLHDFNTSILDNCWNVIEAPSNSSSTSFSISSNNIGTDSGYSAYLFDGTQFSDAAIYLSSPIFQDLSADKKVEFYISDYNGGLTVGTMSNPNDYTTFTPLNEINANVSSSSWEKQIVYLSNYNGTDKHITFRQKKETSSDGTRVYIDDFSYLQSVICNTPTDFTISNTLDNSIDISFTGSGVETEWEIEYEQVGVNNSSVSTIITTENYTINNLLEGTEYSIKLRAKCDDDFLFSDWTEIITFSTACLPVEANYFESFEFENELSPCWSKFVDGGLYVDIFPINNFTRGNSVISPVSGDQFIRFRNQYQEAYELYLISRELINVDNTKRIRFNLISREDSSAPTYNQRSIEIGTMSDPTDISTFNLVDIILPEEMNEFKNDGLPAVPWKEHTIYFNNYNGTDKYIAIRAGSENIRSEFMIDDFYFEEIPTCTEPLYPEVVDERYDAVDITWDTYENSSPASWEVQFGPSGFALGTGITLSTTTNNFTIPNLTDDTNYDFYIRANCGSIFSEWSVKQIFRTKCFGFEVGYFENFDSLPTGLVTGCWTGLRPQIGVPFYDESTSMVSINDDYSSHSSPNAVRLFNEINHPNENVSDEIVLVSPRLIGLDNYKVISFWMYPLSSAYATPSEIIIGTLSDPDDYTTFTPYHTITGAYENEDEWTKHEIDLSDYYLTDEYIGIKQTAINERQLLLIDDFEYTENGCVTPTSLTAEQSDNEEITLSWQDNNTSQSPESWEIEYGSTGFTQGTGTIVTANTNPFTISNLSAFTTYDYYVRAYCNSSDGFSNWSVPYSFNISCAYSTPFYDDFDQYLATNGSAASIPNFCWTRSSNLFYSGTVDVSNYYVSFGSMPNNGFVNFNNSFGNNSEALPGYLTSPYFSDFDNTKMIKFSLRNDSQGSQNNSSGIIIGTMSNPIDRSTFTPFKSISATEIEVFGSEFMVNFSTYQGTDKYIVFMHDATNSYARVNIDNFYYQDIPTCLEPINFKVDTFGDTFVNLSWQDINNSGNYEIEYGETGFTQGTGTILNTSNLSLQINGLLQNTNYEFYIRSNCSTVNSLWTEPITSTTTCNLESIPWQEDFSTMSNYGQGILPDCFLGESDWVSSNINLSDFQVGDNDTHYLYVTYDQVGLKTSLRTPMFNLEAGTTYNFVFKIRKEVGDYSSQSVQIKTGLGNSHESMTTYLHYFADFNFGFYNYYPIETTFTPVISGAYSFGLYFGFSTHVRTITLDSFSLDNGYDTPINPTTAPEVYNFETSLPDSFILESTNESTCNIVTETSTGNKAINMKLNSTLENWVDSSDTNEIWINNQNGINKVNFEIDATNESSLFMNFDLKQFYLNNPNESMFRVIVNGNILLDNIYATNSTDYTKYEVDLSGFIGDNIRVSLQQLGRNASNTSNPSDEAFLDNLKFTSTSTLSIDDINFIGLSYYPNPVNNIFNLKNNINIDSIEVYNIFGQKLLKTIVNDRNSSIDFSDLPSAVYFVKILIENTERTIKVIKN